MQEPNVDLLYFATHGITDLNKPMDGSFLAFSPDSQNATEFITARQIQNSKIHADLIVLSACQSGYGKTMGAGYIGVGRAFFKAGVQNVVSTLWNIDDNATKDLMLGFMDEIQKPDYFFPSNHLRKAILAQKKRTPEP